jgi:phosphate transport system protein
MDKPHTLTVFDEELQQLSGAILRMMELAGSQLHSAIQALVEQDGELARRTVEQDAQVNRLQEVVDGCTLRLLAMRQPFARDLRQVLAAGRMAADLERIADYAGNVARHSLKLAGRRVGRPVECLAEMGRIAGEMLQEVGGAYRRADARAAAAAWRRDRELDRLYTEAYQGLSGYMAREPECVEPCLALVHAGRALERIGDHITNLAEQVYFQVTGRAYPEAGEP